MVAPAPDADPTRSDTASCTFCANPAESTCSRCGRLYCAEHGGSVCDACSAPAAGLPSRSLLYTIAGALAAGAALGVYLLFASPRLPGETPPPPVTAQPPPAATGQPPRAGTQAPPTAATPAAARKYTVKPGDTMGLIAQSFSISVDTLIAANPGVRADSLQIGQELTIPAAP